MCNNTIIKYTICLQNPKTVSLHMYYGIKTWPTQTHSEDSPADLTKPHPPQFGKNLGRKYLERSLQNDVGSCKEGWPADLHVDQVGEHSQMDGGDPQEVEEGEDLEEGQGRGYS